MQSESVDESIEFRGEERVEIVVVFVAGVAEEIEIADEKPRPGDLGKERFHIGDEVIGERVVGGGIDIGYSEGDIGGGGLEHGGEGVAASVGGDEG
jgi:hypothetical protein